MVHVPMHATADASRLYLRSFGAAVGEASLSKADGVLGRATAVLQSGLLRRLRPVSEWRAVYPKRFSFPSSPGTPLFAGLIVEVDSTVSPDRAVRREWQSQTPVRFSFSLRYNL